MMDKKTREILNAQGRVGTNIVEVSEMSVAIDLLNKLIATNRGLITVYRTAVERLENESNKELLQGYVKQHEAFVTELSNLVTSYGGTPVTAADSSSLVKKAWVTLKSAVTEGDGPMLAEVAQDAEKILEAYGEAMGKDLPDDARDLIRQHMSQINVNHEKLSALSAVYNQ
ncbi:MAG: PA2169 family four-helix-bundle protein [Anaerolineae bacterium]